ncbi:MAG TPA: glycosyltransferase family 4 protein [Gemmatimonadales bacterium]|nr:glycosyltransferase family 4 protein [Gemmatimonadales bacterium]
MIWLIGTDDMRLRLPLIEALRARGFAVEVLGTASDEAFTEAGVTFRPYRLDRWIDPWGDWAACRQLRRLFRRHRPDVIHAIDTKPAILAPLAAPDDLIHRTVSTITGLGYLFSASTPLAWSLRPAFHWLQHAASRRTQVMVFQNAEDRRYFLDHGLVRPGSDRLIRGSGIELDGSRPSSERLVRLRRELGLNGMLVVLMISRLVALKGVREYLAAAALVRAQRPDIAFLLAGPVANEGAQAVPLAEVRRAGASVRYLGPRSDVPALLALADLFVLPTRYREGVPRVLLEAAASGLPLITTDLPGCRDVVRHEWNGLLVPPGSAPALADAILRLADAPDRRRAMGSRSRQRVQSEFTLDRVADAYAEVYEGVCRQARPRIGALAL